MCASGVILWGEIRCWSLLGVKGLSGQSWRSLLWTSEEEKHFIPCFPGSFLFLHTSYWKYHTSSQKINTALLSKHTRTHLPLKGQRDFFNSFRASCRLCNNCIRFTCMVKVTYVKLNLFSFSRVNVFCTSTIVSLQRAHVFRGGKQLRTVSILALTSSLHPPLFSTHAKRFSSRAQLFAHYAQSYYVDLNMRHLWWFREM